MVDYDAWPWSADEIRKAVVQAYTLPRAPSFGLALNSDSNLKLTIKRNGDDDKSEEYFYYRKSDSKDSWGSTWTSLLAEGTATKITTTIDADSLAKDEKLYVQVAAALYYPKVIEDEDD